MTKLKQLLAAFTAAAIMLTSCGCSDSGSVNSDSNVSAPSSSAGVTASNDTTSAVSTDSTTVHTQQESTRYDESESISVMYTIVSTWEDGGMTCSQLDFTVTNSSSDAVSGWSFTIDLGQTPEIVQSWNAQLNANSTKLVAANVEYNGELASGAQTAFGCIIKTSSAIATGSITADSAPVSSTAATTTTACATAPVTKPDIAEIDSGETQGLVSQHGQLSVNGADLVDENGEKMQLRGVSTHGVQWFPQFVNKDAFRWLRDEWQINTIRLAMYSGDSEGYNDSTKAGIEQLVQDAVEACIELDMYVIVDWHVLADQSPQVKKADALRFFGYMSEKYGDYPNIIYEICNEPNGYATWEGDVKPYAQEVIPVIRENDPDSIIIVGTPTWSQDIDKALADPLAYDNIMYALHYYAATHTDWLRDRLKNCYNSGMAVFVSEFGNCDASGGGSNDFNQATQWLELLESLNISYMTWALSDKNETCSLLVPGAPATGGWSDSQLSENGKFMRDWFISH